MIGALYPIHQAVTTYWSYPVGITAALELGRGREWSYQKKVIASAAAVLVVTLVHQFAQHLEKLPPSPLFDSLKQVAPYFALLMIGDHFVRHNLEDAIKVTRVGDDKICLTNPAKGWKQEFDILVVSPRGDCLLHALSGGEMRGNEVSDFRNELADHIAAHLNDYRDDIVKELKGLHVENGTDDVHANDIRAGWRESSLKGIIDHQQDDDWLRSTGVDLYLTELRVGSWGTSVEIKAFCERRKTRVAIVEVHTRDGGEDLVFCNVHGSPDDKPLVAILGKDNNHYDALVIVQ